MTGGTELPSRSHWAAYDPQSTTSSGAPQIRFSSAIENLRFSVGCITAAADLYSPLLDITVGDGSPASARTRLKYLSDYFKVEPETDISRYAIGAEYDKLNPGQRSAYSSRARP